MAQATRRKGKRELTDGEKVTVAFSHELRVLAWLAIYQEPCSPVAIAEAFDRPVPNIAYHVRVLLECDCIELAETIQRRGAVEHVYRAVKRLEVRSVEEWEAISPAERHKISLLGVQLIVGDCVAAQNADTFDARLNRHLSRIPMELDDEAWELAARAFDEFRDRLMDIAAECAERVAADPEITTVPTLAGLLMFQRAPLPPKPATEDQGNGGSEAHAD
jgi:hypothetical protein